MQQTVVQDVYRVGKAPAASPTSVLEEDPSDWSWEAPPPRAPVSQPATTSPVCGRTSSSSSDAAYALQRQQNSNIPIPIGQQVGSKTSSRSLVETLHKCLTSLPQFTTTGAVSDPAGATTSSSSAARQSSSSRPVGKRRPRASRRTPTTILETDPSDFRQTVQKLTGIPNATPAPTPSGAKPVRPRPQRANPVAPQTLQSIRRLPPMGPPPRAPSSLSWPPPPDTTLRRNFSPTRRDEHPCHHSSRTSDHVIRPSTVEPAQAYSFARSCKREFVQTEVDHSAFSDSPPSMAVLGSPKSLMKQVMSAPTPSMPSWWEHESQEPESRSISNLYMMTDANAPFAMSSCCSSPSSSCYSIDSLAKENNLPPSEFVPGIDSADGQLAQEEFNFSQIESWLSAESMMHD